MPGGDIGTRAGAFGSGGTYDLGPCLEFPRGAVAAGLLGCGSGILGAAEDIGNMLVDILSDANRSSMEASA